MRKVTGIVFILSFCSLFVFAACGQDTAAQTGKGMDYTTFVNQLRAAKVTVAVLPNNSITPLLSGKQYNITANGAKINIFEYNSAQAAQDDAGTISADGSTIKASAGQSAIVDWVDTPHFYRSGKIIVLYVGRDQKILNLLVSVLGKQFAGDNR